MKVHTRWPKLKYPSS